MDHHHSNRRHQRPARRLRHCHRWLARWRPGRRQLHRTVDHRLQRPRHPPRHDPVVDENPGGLPSGHAGQRVLECRRGGRAVQSFGDGLHADQHRRVIAGLGGCPHPELGERLDEQRHPDSRRIVRRDGIDPLRSQPARHRHLCGHPGVLQLGQRRHSSAPGGIVGGETHVEHRRRQRAGGRCGHHQHALQGEPHACHDADRHRRLRHGQRHGAGGDGLCDHEWRPDFSARPDQRDGDGHRFRRHERRTHRNFLRQSEQPNPCAARTLAGSRPDTHRRCGAVLRRLRSGD